MIEPLQRLKSLIEKTVAVTDVSPQNFFAFMVNIYLQVDVIVCVNRHTFLTIHFKNMRL